MHSTLSSEKIILGLLAIQPIIQCLEGFNRGLQRSSLAVSGMLNAADITRSGLTTLRIEDQFRVIYQSSQGDVEEYDLTPVVLPCRRKIPRKIMDDGYAAHPSTETSEELFRIEFFKTIDSAVMHLDEAFKSTDLTKYNLLASALITGYMSSSVLDDYRELSPLLPQELSLFHSTFQGKTGKTSVVSSRT